MWLFSGSKSVTLSWICWFEKRNNVPTFEHARAVTRFSFRTRGARSVGDERCVPSLGFLDGMEWITPLLSGSPLIFRRKKGRGGSGRGREGGRRRSAALSANPIQSWVGMDAHGVILILLPSVLLMPWHHLESVE